MDISRTFENTRDIIKGIVQKPVSLQHETDLTSAEIATLWNTYMYYSALSCIIKYSKNIARDNNDSELMSLLSQGLESFDTRLKWIANTFNKEGLTIPTGFSEEDVNLDAPQLYSTSYLLYYTRNMVKLGLNVHTLNINMSTRPDVRDFFYEIITTILEINKKVTNIMLERGILPRHPTINVSDKVGFTQKPSFLAGFIGDRRPLLAVEIAHLSEIIEMNYIGRVLLAGFSQVAKSDRVRDYMNKGVKMADDIIKTLTSILKEENITPPLPGDAITTDSKTAPFSDKLIMFHIQLLGVSGISMYSAALGHSLRHDITQKYALIAVNAGRYAEEGIKIMIENSWMEEPPQIATTRLN